MVVVPQVVKEVSIDTKTEKNTALGSAKVEVLKAANMEQVFPVLAKQIVSLASPPPSTFIRGRAEASAVPANEEKGEVVAEDEEERAEAEGGGEEKLEEESAGLGQATELVGMHAVPAMAPITPYCSQPGFSWSSSPPRRTGKFSSEVEEGNVKCPTLSKSEEEEEVVAKDEEETAEAGGGGEEKVDEEELFAKLDEEVHFSVEQFEYDEASGQFSYQGHPVQFASKKLRDQVLAKMFPSPSPSPSLPSTTPACTSVPAPKPEELGQSPAFPKPLNLRHQQQRLAFAHLKTSNVKSLGKQTRWTKELLLTTLENAISNPRLGIHWADFSEEEKLGTFNMIDWAAAYPDDIPSRSLLLESEDQWSTWA